MPYVLLFGGASGPAMLFLLVVYLSFSALYLMVPVWLGLSMSEERGRRGDGIGSVAGRQSMDRPTVILSPVLGQGAIARHRGRSADEPVPGTG